ncbi:MAG: hypothetical protein ACRDZZ_03565 [Ilumatobacteraceae bacterium]
MATYGYDPERIEILDRRAREALGALAAIRSDDPAAVDAMRAVARMRSNLEHAWVPFIDAIRTSTAMTAWRAALEGGRAAHARPAASSGHGWIATNGLDHLTDGEIVDRLDAAIGRLRDAVTSGDDVAASEHGLAVLAEEAVRRSRHGPAVFAAASTGRLGARGAVAILGAIDALDGSARRDPRRHGIPPAALDLAELLASLSGTASVADLIGDHLLASTALAPLIAATSRSWDPDVLVHLAAGLIHAIDERDYVLTAITPIALAGNVGSLVAALADHPPGALALLDDDAALVFLATNRYVDADDVEAIFTAALLRAPRTGSEPMRDGLDALARLVAITDDEVLSDGAKRGLAASMLTFFPVVTPHLDVRLPVVVPYGTSPDHTVEVGEYCDVQRLIGQLLADGAAQLVLGAVTDRYRALATAGLGGAIVARPAEDAGEHRARIATALADVSAVDALVMRSRAAQTSLAAYEHGVLLGRARSVITWASTIGSAVVSSSSPVLGPSIPIASKVVIAALDLVEPERVHDLDLDAAAAIGFTVTVVGLPTRAPRTRTALGLGSVPAATWQRLDDLLDELGDTDDHRRRIAIHSAIVAITDDDPDLDLFVSQIETLGGGAANAGPQPPAACS